MSQADSEFWNRARQARDKLAGRYLDHPEVSLIDIGYDPEGGEETKPIVLRVHVRRVSAAETMELPLEINGIPVRVIVADYRPE